MKLANRSKVYTSMSIVFDNRENCKQCQPSLNGLVSTGVYSSIAPVLLLLRVVTVVYSSLQSFIYAQMADEKVILGCLRKLLLFSKRSQKVRTRCV